MKLHQVLLPLLLSPYTGARDVATPPLPDDGAPALDPEKIYNVAGLELTGSGIDELFYANKLPLNNEGKIEVFYTTGIIAPLDPDPQRQQDFMSQYNLIGPALSDTFNLKDVRPFSDTYNLTEWLDQAGKAWSPRGDIVFTEVNAEDAVNISYLQVGICPHLEQFDEEKDTTPTFQHTATAESLSRLSICIEDISADQRYEGNVQGIEKSLFYSNIGKVLKMKNIGVSTTQEISEVADELNVNLNFASVVAQQTGYNVFGKFFQTAPELPTPLDQNLLSYAYFGKKANDDVLDIAAIQDKEEKIEEDIKERQTRQSWREGFSDASRTFSSITSAVLGLVVVVGCTREYRRRLQEQGAGQSQENPPEAVPAEPNAPEERAVEIGGVAAPQLPLPPGPIQLAERGNDDIADVATTQHEGGWVARVAAESASSRGALSEGRG